MPQRSKSGRLQRALAFSRADATIRAVSTTLAESHPWAQRPLLHGVAFAEARRIARRARGPLDELAWRGGVWREA